MEKIIFISEDEILNENKNGITKIVFNLVDGLRKKGFRVDHHNSPVAKKTIFKKIFGLRPLSVKLHDGDDFKLAKEIESFLNDYELVHLVGVGYGGVFQYLNKKSSSKIIWTIVDSLSLHYFTRFQNESNFIKKILLYGELIRTEYYEKKIRTLRFPPKVLIFVSLKDASKFVANSNYRLVDVVPNGVNLNEFTSVSQEQVLSSPVKIIYTGNMDYYPNHLAGMELIKQLGSSEFQITIAGSNPRADLKSASLNMNVQVLGFVPKMADELRRADVFVSLLTTGSGIKNKILEAMAVGLCVIGTSMSFDGIDCTDGVDCIVLDDVNKVKIVLSELDMPRIKEIGDNARKLMLSKYSWERVCDKYLEIYRS